jgi:hypothetical protein
MSIKRTKQASYGSRNKDYPSDGPFAAAKPAEPTKTWAELMEGKGDDAFVPYSMTAKFAKGALISHPKFGRGAVVGVEGPRIEVLFEDGTKKLGHAG